jgi:short-subunit dehydrogenase
MSRYFRTAIVTGASRGIGPYIARSLAKEGLNLVLAARSQDELKAVAAEIQSSGTSVLAIQTDVTEHQSLVALVAAAERQFGQIDVLVNNAGGDPQREFHNYSQTELEYIIQLNLSSAIFLSHLVLPGMIEQKQGSIINISSMAGWMGFPHTEAYAACKSGLVGFTRVLRNDYGKVGIGSTAVVLGTIWGAGTTTRTIEETGIAMPSMAKLFASSPETVGKAVVRALKRNPAEIVVMPGPGRLMKLQL